MAFYEKDVQGVRSYSQNIVPLTIDTGNVTIDLSKGSIFTLELNANIDTVTYLNVPSQSASYVLFITADGFGYTVTWGSLGFKVRFPGNTPPTLTEISGAVDILGFQSSDNGSAWSGFVAGQSYNYDPIPAPVNWGDITGDSAFGFWTYSTQQITGISSPITLSANYAEGTQLYYKVDTVEPNYNDDPSVNPSGYGFSTINNSGTVVVNNDDWLSFGVQDKSVFAVDSVTIENISDNNTVLDTFNATAS